MSETLSRILYNNAGEASAASEGTTYDAALRDTQNYLSQNHAGTLAETVLQEQARETVRFLIEQYLTTHKVYAGGLSIQELTTRLYRDMAGYSILEEPLADPGVEEIIVNGYDDIEIVDENGRRKTGLRFGNGEQARDIARRLVRLSGHSIDTAHPMVDAYITTGVRVTALFPPLIPDEAGAAFTIRKQRLGNVTRSQLIRWGTASEEVLDFLEACLDHGVSVSIAGKTGSGKTTLLSYLLNNLDERQRIVTIKQFFQKSQPARWFCRLLLIRYGQTVYAVFLIGGKPAVQEIRSIRHMDSIRLNLRRLCRTGEFDGLEKLFRLPGDARLHIVPDKGKDFFFQDCLVSDHAINREEFVVKAAHWMPCQKIIGKQRLDHPASFVQPGQRLRLCAYGRILRRGSLVWMLDAVALSAQAHRFVEVRLAFFEIENFCSFHGEFLLSLGNLANPFIYTVNWGHLWGRKGAMFCKFNRLEV